jgi:hypothetical protein
MMAPHAPTSIASADEPREMAVRPSDQLSAPLIPPDTIDKRFIRANVALLIWIHR